MKKILILASLLLINGCATYEYVQPNKSQADMQRAYAICDLESDKATMYIRNEFTRVYESVKLTIRCMKIKGYNHVEVKK